MLLQGSFFNFLGENDCINCSVWYHRCQPNLFLPMARIFAPATLSTPPSTRTTFLCWGKTCLEIAVPHAGQSIEAQASTNFAVVKVTYQMQYQ